MHDSLFANQQALGNEDLLARASALKLDLGSYGQCVNQADDVVRRDVAAAKALGITGTPAFLIGSLEGGDSVRVSATIKGAAGLDRFTKIVDDLLNKKD